MIDRYVRPEMGYIWSDENRVNRWLEVEILACEAWAREGVIPDADVQLIRKKAQVDLQRMREIEQEIHHDVIAFTRAVTEQLGPEAKWIHYGLTSTDVVDTALGSILKQANELLLQGVDGLIEALREKAKIHQYTVMMGRTHGVHAEPTTFGLKLALWYDEMKRNRQRLVNASKEVQVGKISGAVGTYANVGTSIEAYVCEKLGLAASPISTQTLQRDRHAHYLSVLSLIASSLDKFATEIRALQKSEVREVEEFFASGQKGSSAMPHKRNPIGCENISGLSRVMRGYMISAYENVTLWHERDISHSSVERIILPDSTILLDYMLHRFTRIIERLQVFPENMKRNMGKTWGLIYSQRVLLQLIEKGISREEAYDRVQQLAMRAWEEQTSFALLLKEDTWMTSCLQPSEIDDCFDERYHLTYVDEIYHRLGISMVSTGQTEGA